MPISETKQCSASRNIGLPEPTPVPRTKSRRASWLKIDYGDAVFLVASYRRPVVSLCVTHSERDSAADPATSSRRPVGSHRR